MSQVTDGQPEKPYVPQKYPGWRVPKDGGAPVIVHNHIQEEAVTGIRVNPDGSPVEIPALEFDGGVKAVEETPHSGEPSTVQDPLATW